MYYLDNSGRPEMKVLNKAAKQGQLTDLKPLLKDTNVYKKYLRKIIYLKIRVTILCFLKI